MAWLLRDGEVLASLEVCGSARSRARGLLGRDGVEGAVLLRPASSVHTFGMRFPIDVAHCTRDLIVLHTATMARNRLALPHWRARAVLEAEAGSFARWGLAPGQQLEVSGDAP